MNTLVLPETLKGVQKDIAFDKHQRGGICGSISWEKSCLPEARLRSPRGRGLSSSCLPSAGWGMVVGMSREQLRG